MSALKVVPSGIGGTETLPSSRVILASALRAISLSRSQITLSKPLARAVLITSLGAVGRVASIVAGPVIFWSA